MFCRRGVPPIVHTELSVDRRPRLRPGGNRVSLRPDTASPPDRDPEEVAAHAHQTAVPGTSTGFELENVSTCSDQRPGPGTTRGRVEDTGPGQDDFSRHRG
jgi:hypothetical protein